MYPICLWGGAAASCLFLPVPVRAQVRDAGEATIGASVRHAGKSCNDTASTIRVAGHIRGEYSGYPAANVDIGAPRSFEAALATRS